MGLRDAESEYVGFTSQEHDPKMGLCDAESESVGFTSQEHDPKMGLCDAKSESVGFTRWWSAPIAAGAWMSAGFQWPN